MKQLLALLFVIAPCFAADRQAVGPVTAQLERSADPTDRAAFRYKLWLDTDNELTDAFQVTFRYVNPRQPGVHSTASVVLQRARAARRVPTYHEFSFKASIVSLLVEEIIYERTSSAEFSTPD